MEGYIKKINHKVITKYDESKQKKVKKIYQIIGGIVVGLGAAGFIASFMAFMILFFHFQTDGAFTAWILAVPCVLLLTAGAVVTRIGDMLLRENVEIEYQKDLENKKDKKKKKQS